MMPVVPLLIPYIAITFLHTVLQEHYAAKDGGTAHEGEEEDQSPGPTTRWPAVDVVIPTYNEDPHVLDACCASLVEQDYKGEMRFLLVDDGSTNLPELLPVYRRYAALPGWAVLQFSNGNRGKRKAQNVAIYGAKPESVAIVGPKDPGTLSRVLHGSNAEFVLMVDSDTVIDSDGVRRILAPFTDGTVAAVTGDVRVLNRDVNRLTKLIDERYRLLFRHERAAQSFFGRVFCCAGPFSAYRLKALDKIWREYVERKFLGAPCTFGDDLQLTNLVLKQGHRSLYEPTAKALTTAPTGLWGYLRQQWRWNRSFYRELWSIISVLRKNPHPYLVLDQLARAVPPLLLGGAFAVTAWDLLRLDLSRFVAEFMHVAAMLLVSLALALWQTRKLDFAVLYGLLYVGLLIATRLWALCTLRNTSWGTRTGRRRPLSAE
jgi:cellulose synthase/poly-beta-1,6-N-acetylglucosamine synthase-like glycosyltransferase